MTTPEACLEKWLTVEQPTLWGTSSPFDLVDGGKESLMKEMLAVTSDLKHFPKDGSPYGSLLAGRLATQSDLTAAEAENLGVFVQIDKDPRCSRQNVEGWREEPRGYQRHRGCKEVEQGAEAGGRTRRSWRTNARSSKKQAWDG